MIHVWDRLLKTWHAYLWLWQMIWSSWHRVKHIQLMLINQNPSVRESFEIKDRLVRDRQLTSVKPCTSQRWTLLWTLGPKFHTTHSFGTNPNLFLFQPMTSYLSSVVFLVRSDHDGHRGLSPLIHFFLHRSNVSWCILGYCPTFRAVSQTLITPQPSLLQARCRTLRSSCQAGLVPNAFGFD